MNEQKTPNQTPEQIILLDISDALTQLGFLKQSRKVSFVKTNLEQARLWLLDELGSPIPYKKPELIAEDNISFASDCVNPAEYLCDFCDCTSPNKAEYELSVSQVSGGCLNICGECLDRLESKKPKKL